MQDALNTWFPFSVYILSLLVIYVQFHISTIIATHYNTLRSIFQQTNEVKAFEEIHDEMREKYGGCKSLWTVNHPHWPFLGLVALVCILALLFVIDGKPIMTWKAIVAIVLAAGVVYLICLDQCYMNHHDSQLKNLAKKINEAVDGSARSNCKPTAQDLLSGSEK